MVRRKSRSFQEEVPPSRVNIRYVKYIGDAQEKVELPLKLLVLGDFTFNKDGGEPLEPLEERKRIDISKTNFAEVLKNQNLKLSMTVPNRLTDSEGDELKVDLSVDSLNAFTPDEIVQRVPELKKMLELRNLLRDLKGRVITNRGFRIELNKLLAENKGNQEALEALRGELDRIAPLEDPSVIKGELESESEDEH